MATSSIFADFTIRDKKTARAFVKALEALEKTAATPATAPPLKVLSTQEEISQFFAGNNTKRGRK